MRAAAPLDDLTELATRAYHEASRPAPATPTIWGMTPEQLHERFWAARGVQVVRVGVRQELAHDAELFLLVDARLQTIFRLARAVELMTWTRPRLLTVRLHDTQQVGYRERILTTDDGRFLRFERHYHGEDFRLGRVGLTRDRAVAEVWQRAAGFREGWRTLRAHVEPRYRAMLSLDGQVYDGTDPHELMRFTHELVRIWNRPDATVRRVRRAGVELPRGRSGIRSEAWVDGEASVSPTVRFVGPVWVGAGRQLTEPGSVVGPAVLWDDPERRPASEALTWDQIEPITQMLERASRRRQFSSIYVVTKRLFDIAFALVALFFTLPFYPLIMLAIYLEDGRPFFFAHRRETRGPREFPCLKFRSMRNNAEQVKEQLAAMNVADGPQFFIEKDPRHTRVGRFLRKTQLDELPQFFNVLVGHMSIVGPRPSPYRENQFCPPWREARLSVRPGITGLWQVKRTREPGKDFQEWIKFDLEYVANAGWKMDLTILIRTFLMVVGIKA